MELILEIRNQDNETPRLDIGAVIVTSTPPVSGDYWSYRVRLSDTQAVLGFPKFSTIGIGFAVENDSWNTNMPYDTSTDRILDHIIDNKGDDGIDDTNVREAIRMIQLAVIDERAVTRREDFNRARAATDNVSTVPIKLFDEVMTHLHHAMRESAILRAEVDHLRAAPVPDAFPGASPIPDGTCGFVTLLARLGVPTRDARVLAADGKWEMPQDIPIRALVDEATRHSPSETVGRLVGLYPLGSDIYGMGVTTPELAEDLNLGRLVLRVDMEADAVESGALQGDPTRMLFSSGRVIGAMVGRPEGFAWATS